MLSLKDGLAQVYSDNCDQYIDYYENYVCPELKFLNIDLVVERTDEEVDPRASSLIRKHDFGW